MELALIQLVGLDWREERRIWKGLKVGGSESKSREKREK